MYDGACALHAWYSFLVMAGFTPEQALKILLVNLGQKVED